MGKKKKKGAKVGAIDKKTVGYVLAGVLLAVVVYKVGTKLVENYKNGIGVSVKKVRFKFTGSLIKFSLFGFDINIPKYATWLVDAQIRNDNAIGGQVQGFDGYLMYGAPPGGVNIAPLKANPFNLAGNSTVTTTIQIDQDLTSLPLTAKGIVAKIRSGEYKKVFIAGSLRTSYGNVKIAQEVSLLSA